MEFARESDLAWNPSLFLRIHARSYGFDSHRPLHPQPTSGDRVGFKVMPASEFLENKQRNGAKDAAPSWGVLP